MARPLMFAVATVLAADLAVAANLARAQQWPQWRGPQRTGVADGARLPGVWPAALPPPRWRRR